MTSGENQVAAIESEIAHLRGLDLHGLRARWRSLTGRAAPAHVPRTLLLRVLAYRLQATALGDLDRVSARLLERIASAGRAGKQAAIPVPDRMGVKPGDGVGPRVGGHAAACDGARRRLCLER
jgi:Protein of unknown function (DUF2924)